jgi:cytochrome c
VTIRLVALCLGLLAGLVAARLAVAADSSGDAERGRQVFAGCRTCHYPELGYGHHNGPSLHAIFGRRAGTQEGFEYYSPWLRQAGFVWTPELLDTWLANPAMFPDSTMVFAGVPDPQDRADLLAYLARFR